MLAQVTRGLTGTDAAPVIGSLVCPVPGAGVPSSPLAISGIRNVLTLVDGVGSRAGVIRAGKDGGQESCQWNKVGKHFSRSRKYVCLVKMFGGLSFKAGLLENAEC